MRVRGLKTWAAFISAGKDGVKSFGDGWNDEIRMTNDDQNDERQK
jgi:hypothetical protein